VDDAVVREVIHTLNNRIRWLFIRSLLIPVAVYKITTPCAELESSLLVPIAHEHSLFIRLGDISGSGGLNVLSLNLICGRPKPEAFSQVIINDVGIARR